MKWRKPHYEFLLKQPMLPRSCWCPTSLQLLKAWRVSWPPPQRKWGLCKLSPWVGKAQTFAKEKEEAVMLAHWEQKSFLLLNCNDIFSYRWCSFCFTLFRQQKCSSLKNKLNSMKKWMWLYHLLFLLLDTLSVLARTIGKDVFSPLAAECVQLGLNLTDTIDDPDLRRCTYVT